MTKEKLYDGTEVPVKYYHLRHAFSIEPASISVRALASSRVIKTAGVQPEPKGGVTLAALTLPDGDVIFGMARCSSLDNFSRPKGRLISTGRAKTRAEHEKLGLIPAPGSSLERYTMRVSKEHVQDVLDLMRMRDEDASMSLQLGSLAKSLGL